MKRKTSHNSIKKDSVSKKGYVFFDDYTDLFTFKKVPISEAYIDRLATELLDWALNNDDALKMSQFYLGKGISYHSFSRWLKRSKNLEEAHNSALKLLGNRREIGAIKKKYDTSMIATMMPKYDEDWKEVIEWRSKLKEQEASNETKIVVIEKAPNSNIVPEKK